MEPMEGILMEINFANCEQNVALHSTSLSTSLLQHTLAVPLKRHLRRLIQGVILLGCHVMHIVGFCRSYMQSSLPLLSPAQLGQQLHWSGGDLLLAGVSPPLQAA